MYVERGHRCIESACAQTMHIDGHKQHLSQIVHMHTANQPRGALPAMEKWLSLSPTLYPSPPLSLWYGRHRAIPSVLSYNCQAQWAIAHRLGSSGRAGPVSITPCEANSRCLYDSAWRSASTTEPTHCMNQATACEFVQDGSPGLSVHSLASIINTCMYVCVWDTCMSPTNM